MANELERLRELNARLQLVPKGQTVEQLLRNASDFTHAAAKMLHSEGWRRIRKTEGTRVDDMDVDKLVSAQTFDIVDIVIAAGATNATVAWQRVGTLTDTSRFIEVKPDAPKPAPPEPLPPPARPDDPLAEEFLEGMRGAVTALDETNRQLDRIADALEQLAGVLVNAAKRFSL